jgi:hypothetical protein
MPNPSSPTWWQRFVRLYTMLGIVVLNTLVVVFVIEGAAALINKLDPPNTLAETTAEYKTRMVNMEYYRSQAWSADYWEEHLQVVDHWGYYPYTVWRTEPFAGEQINVGEDRIRVTPGSECGEDTYRIFAFGGSTIWGFGSPDWGTIPAYIQKNMEERDVCILTQGDLAFNSTQNVIRLIQLLQQGDVPDMVIFYDGINDVATASRTSKAGSHYFIEYIEPVVKGALKEKESVGSLLRELVTRTAIYQVPYGDVFIPDANWDLPPFAPEFIEAITSIYLTNIHLVEILAEAYEFEFVAVIQPVLPLVESDYNEEEQAIMWRTPQGMADLFRTIYPYWEEAAAENDHLYYFAHILDDQPYPIWIDHSHVTPWGNLVVAHEITEVILPIIDAALGLRTK